MTNCVRMPLIPNFVVMANSEDLEKKDSRRTQLTKYKTALVYFFGLLILESGNLYKFGAFGLISDQQATTEEAEASTARLRKTLDDFKDQDLHQLEGDDLEDFLHAKEAQYEERRSRVERFCQDLRATGDSTLKRLSHVNPRYTQYNPEDGVGYCGIPKCGSSTWNHHFYDMAPQWKQKEWKVSKQTKGPSAIFPLPPDLEVEDAFNSSNLTSLVVVRHPFGRIASAYQGKFVAHGWAGKPLNREVNKFAAEVRGENPSAAELDQIPPPENFGLYLLEFSRSNIHWKPMHLQCPFCRVNYTIYSRMETMAEDLAYLLSKVKSLKGKIKPSMLVNSRNPDKKLRSDANFWSKLAPEVIADLYEVYRIDFELFGYSLAEYFRPIGLEAKAAEVERILSKGGRRGEEL